ncbi:MAG: hypothetical protein HY280_06985 [Nitrospinae bacterium]|nr:hypothetical protein [Nitrospinota bacterium]
MKNQDRKEPRRIISGQKPVGEVKLSQIPDGLKYEVNNISPSGASITFAGQLKSEAEANLLALTAASKRGNHITVQLALNGVRIPVNLMNMVDSKTFGIRISSNEKLAPLAERGRAVFNEVFQEAAKKGAEEAPFEPHQFPSREFLPDDVKEFVAGPMFGPLFISALADELPVLAPTVKDKVEGVGEYMKLADLCKRFLETTGKDVAFMVGVELSGPGRAEEESPDDALPAALHKICVEGRLFANEAERASFESILANRYFKNKGSDASGELSAKHPSMGIIKTRFDGFDHEQGFYLTLGPFVADYFFHTYLPRGSEIVRVVGADKRQIKNTIVRWTHNVLSQINSDKDKTVANDIETRFKNAMHLYMTAKKRSIIITADVMHIIDGKGITPAMDFRPKFFHSVCAIIEPEINKKFAEYMAERNKDDSGPDVEDRETLRIMKLAPLDLVREFLWPEIVRMGLATQLNKEVARTFVPKEKDLTIAEFGGMIVFDIKGYEAFLAAFPSYINVSNIPDFFDKIDFKALYDRTVMTAIGEKKDGFGLFVDGQKPNVLKEKLVNEVISSPNFSTFYILKKPKSFFQKTFTENSGWLEFIEKTLQTSNPGEGFV